MSETKTGKPRKPTGQRVSLIQGLLRVGGKLEANGRGYLGRTEIISTLGLPPRSNPASLTALMRAAEKDGVIRREINGKRTKSIELIDAQGIEAGPALSTEVEVVDDASPAPRRRQARAMKPMPMPNIGEGIEVFMISRDRDGTLHMGIRDDQKSWLTEVQGFAIDTEE